VAREGSTVQGATDERHASCLPNKIVDRRAEGVPTRDEEVRSEAVQASRSPDATVGESGRLLLKRAGQRGFVT
jgi:hypothetical protein